jgi:hypothetical protein
VQVTPGLGSFTVSWTSNVPATTRVNYGTSSALTQYTRDTSLVTAHRITVSALARSTLYYWQAQSAYGPSTTRSAIGTVTTPLGTRQAREAPSPAERATWAGEGLRVSPGLSRLLSSSAML